MLRIGTDTSDRFALAEDPQDSTRNLPRSKTSSLFWKISIKTLLGPANHTQPLIGLLFPAIPGFSAHAHTESKRTSNLREHADELAFQGEDSLQRAAT